MKYLIIAFLCLPLILNSCQGKKQNTEQAEEQIKKFEIVEQWRTDTSLRVPESVLYDKSREILYVSNLNYEPRKKDGNGFISKLGKDGKIIELHWVDGLNSPKGLGISGDKLYAADIDEMVEIDINQGKITNRYTIEGIKMINDIASDPEGNLYISDSDANRIYKFSNGVMTEWLAEGLNSPNGLLVDGNRLLLASQGSKDFCSIDLATKQKVVITEGVNRGDGIAWTGIPGYYLVTDWEGELFMVNPDSSKVSLLNTKAEKGNCADLAYIPEEKLLILPSFYKHHVIGYKLNEINK